MINEMNKIGGDNKSSTYSKFTKSNQDGKNEEVTIDKSNTRLSDRDVEILKSKINVEYQRYNEFA